MRPVYVRPDPDPAFLVCTLPCFDLIDYLYPTSSPVILLKGVMFLLLWDTPIGWPCMHACLIERENCLIYLLVGEWSEDKRH